MHTHLHPAARQEDILLDISEISGEIISTVKYLLIFFTISSGLIFLSNFTSL